MKTLIQATIVSYIQTLHAIKLLIITCMKTLIYTSKLAIVS